MAESGPRKIMISFQMDEGDPLGATPDEKLVLVRIQNQTLADGRFQVSYSFFICIFFTFSSVIKYLLSMEKRSTIVTIFTSCLVERIQMPTLKF